MTSSRTAMKIYIAALFRVKCHHRAWLYIYIYI
jgi:hypothetical protein